MQQEFSFYFSSVIINRFWFINLCIKLNTSVFVLFVCIISFTFYNINSWNSVIVSGMWVESYLILVYNLNQKIN